MTTQKLIVIVGATGAQGGSVLNTFLQDPSYHIRALTRDATSAKAQALSAKSSNIEVVSADISDPASLKTAFQNATSIFIMTDWMSNFKSPAVQKATLPPGQSRVQYACGLETKQAQEMFDIASTIPTLERLVFSTLARVSKLSNGKYTHVYHFDSKALAVEYLQSKHPELWKKTSLIQMGAYLENFLGMDLFKPQKDSKTGEVVFGVIGSNEGPETLWPYVVTGEDVGPVVRALIDQVPAGKHVLVTRGMMPLSELAKIFERITGFKTRVEGGKSLEGFPDDLKVVFADTFAFPKDIGYSGGDESVIMPNDVGVKLDSVEDWIKKQDWTKVLAE